jgi:hypothetical protein
VCSAEEDPPSESGKGATAGSGGSRPAGGSADAAVAGGAALLLPPRDLGDLQGLVLAQHYLQQHQALAGTGGGAAARAVRELQAMQQLWERGGHAG